MKNNSKTIALIACAAAILGSFMPWATVQAAFVKLDINGMAVDGQWTIFFAILAGVPCYFGKRLWLGMIGCILGALTSIADVVRILDKIAAGQKAGVTGTVGIGLYLCAAGFITALFMLRSMSKATKAAVVIETVSWPAPQSV